MAESEERYWGENDIKDTIDSIDQMLKGRFNDGKTTADSINNKIKKGLLVPDEEQVLPIDGLTPEDIHTSFDHAATTILSRSFVQNVVSQDLFQQPNTHRKMTLEEQIRWFKTKAHAAYYRSMHNISFSLNNLASMEQKEILPNSGLIWIDPQKSTKKPPSVEASYLQETSGNGDMFYYPNGELTTIIGMIKRLALLRLFNYPLNEQFQMDTQPTFITKKNDENFFLINKAYPSSRTPNVFVWIKEKYSIDNLNLSSVHEDLICMSSEKFKTWFKYKT